MPEKVAIAPASSVATSLDDGVERDGLLGEEERAAGDGRDQGDHVAVARARWSTGAYSLLTA